MIVINLSDLYLLLPFSNAQLKNFKWRPIKMAYNTVEDFLNNVEQKNPHQSEFHQAVKEVAESLWPFLERNSHYLDSAVFDRIAEP